MAELLILEFDRVTESDTATSMPNWGSTRKRGRETGPPG
jgi:hypothetical protein